MSRAAPAACSLAPGSELEVDEQPGKREGADQYEDEPTRTVPNVAKASRPMIGQERCRYPSPYGCGPIITT